MSDIEKARRQLEIAGYQHPEKIITVTDKLYKTLDTETEGKKYESVSKNTGGYATFTSKEDIKELSKQCPICGKQALYACECELDDKQCENGHIWFTNKDKQIQIGDPHE